MMDTLKENSVLIAGLAGIYFLFIRDNDSGSPTAAATGPGGSAYWYGVR